MNRKNAVSVILLLFVVLAFSAAARAAGGCCPSSAGVCECRCCDGSPMLPGCVQYYPECFFTTDADYEMPYFKKYKRGKKSVQKSTKKSTKKTSKPVRGKSARILINGSELSDRGLIVRRTTLVPVRSVFENLGAVVSFDNTSREITVGLGSRTISLRLGRKVAHIFHREYYEGTAQLDVPLEVAPQIIHGRTYVPLRFIAESLGAEVHWNGKIQTIDITKKLSEFGDPYLMPQTRGRSRIWY